MQCKMSLFLDLSEASLFIQAFLSLLVASSTAFYARGVWNSCVELRQLWCSSSLGQTETKHRPAPSGPEQCQGQESTTGACQARLSHSSRHGSTMVSFSSYNGFTVCFSMWSLTLTFWDHSCPETINSSLSHPRPPPLVPHVGRHFPASI